MIEAAAGISMQIEQNEDKHLKHLKRLPPPPVDAFPVEIQALIGRAVETFGTTPEIVIAALLAISGGTIGARLLLRIKPQWTPHAALYLLVSAVTGDSKSPVINWLMEPVEAQEKAWLDDYRDLMDLYELKIACLAKGDQKPEKPVRKQIKVGDITTEALVDALNANPCGLIRYRDEGRAFFTDADKYSGATGSDQTKYLEAYDRRPIQVDRVGKDRVSYVHRPCLALFGSIQPKVLTSCFTDLDTASGYLGRFIILHSQQQEPALWTEQSMTAADVALWHKLVDTFINPDMREDEIGQIIDVTPKAKAAYIEYYNKLTMLPFMEPDVFREILSKSKEHALRLCLILHCIEHAVAGTNELEQVTEATMTKAIKLAEWVYAHNVRTWEMIIKRLEEADKQPVEKRVAQAIYDLQDKIENSFLSTAQITEQVNTGCDDKFHLTANTVGRICSGKLILAKKGDTSKRGYIISLDDLERLETEYTLTLDASNACNACNENGKQAFQAFQSTSIKAYPEKEQKPEPPLEF